MMLRHAAYSLLDQLEPLLPDDSEVTAVPWDGEGPRDEWIVTVWNDEGDALADIFGVGRGYVVRKVGRGALLARTHDGDVAALAGEVRTVLAGQES